MVAVRTFSFVTKTTEIIDTSRATKCPVDRGGDCFDQRRIIHPLFFSSSMAAIAGCSHVICFKRYQCYAAMMTGNVVNFAVALADSNLSEAKFRLSMIGSYFAGTICSRLIERREVYKQDKDKQHHKIVATIVVGMFAIVDKMPDDQKMKLFLLSAAYGIVYATANQALNSIVTQLMTGHITKLGTGVADRLRSANRCWNEGTLMSCCILCSFTIGCTLGARIFVFIDNEEPVFTVIGVIYAILLLLFRG